MGGSGSSSAPVERSGGSAASIRTGAFTVSIPKGMAAEAAAAAKELGITKAQLVKRALADMLEEIEDMKAVKARRHEKGDRWEDVKAELGL